MTVEVERGAMAWAERGWVPDFALRAGIRRLCRERQQSLPKTEAEGRAHEERLQAMFRRGPLAVLTDKANEQHYEVPPEFFMAVLGPHRKYSSAWFPRGSETLGEAEEAALAATCERARLEDGQDVLELGCGWGSPSLWMAAHYPNSRLTVVSNSRPQREFIEAEASRRGHPNLRVITADINQLQLEGRFDRIVSVEMFEHVRNHAELFARLAGWLRPAGFLFAHVFCHRDWTYAFENEDGTDWMARHFFSGGIMPARDLLLRVCDPLRPVQSWEWDGTHYQKTAEAWLRNLDRNRDHVKAIFLRSMPKVEANRWFHRWRIFFLACAELFGFDCGRQWLVVHHLFQKPG